MIYITLLSQKKKRDREKKDKASCYIRLLCYFTLYSKTVPWISPMHKERAYYFYSPRHYKLSKKTSAAHYRGTIDLAVLELK